jgi:hypothetical protein
VTARMVRNDHSRSKENEQFGVILQRWLREHDIEAASGVIIVTLQREGFSLLGLGPTDLTREEMLHYLNWVVRTSITAEDQT